jgi:hypothetical protein
MKVIINWIEVRHLMIDRGIQSYAQLAKKAGVNKNTMGRPGPFSSTTLGKLAECLVCDPCSLILVQEKKGAPITPAQLMPEPAVTKGE